MSTEFDRVVVKFRESLLQYKVTGQPVFKQQYENAEKWLNDYVGALQTNIQRDATYIDKFAKDYENTNPDLVKFSKEIAEARKKGPVLQDVYEGEKIARSEAPIDEGSYYTKAAVVGGILAIGAVASFL